MNAVTTTDADPLDKALVRFNEQLATRQGELAKVLPSHISPERFQRTLLTVATTNPDLLRADRRTLITACLKAAQDGLLPDGREAAIVVFENSYRDGNEWKKVKEAQYMPMVYGLRKKIIQSGEISSLTTQVVYKCEEAEGRFLYEEGTESMLRHKPKLDMSDEEATDDNIIAAYSMVTFKDGTKSYEVLPRRELNKIQRASKTGSPVDRNGKPRDFKGPWKDWYSEMCRKSALRRHSKTLPMSGDLLDSLNEGFDDNGAGESVARTFASAEPDAPTRLPSPEELDANAQGYDPQTGEVDDEQDGQDEREADAAAEREAAQMQGQVDDGDNDVREQLENSDGQAAEETEQPSQGKSIDFDDQADLIIEQLKARETVPDVNSYMFSDAVRDVLKEAPDSVIERVEKAKRGRISEIQNQGLKK